MESEPHCKERDVHCVRGRTGEAAGEAAGEAEPFCGTDTPLAASNTCSAIGSVALGKGGCNHQDEAKRKREREGGWREKVEVEEKKKRVRAGATA